MAACDADATPPDADVGGGSAEAVVTTGSRFDFVPRPEPKRHFYDYNWYHEYMVKQRKT